MELSMTTRLRTCQVPTRYLLFLIIGSTIWCRAVDAYAFRQSQKATISSKTATSIINGAIGRNIARDDKNRVTRLHSLRLYSSERSDTGDESDSKIDESSVPANIAIANVTAGTQFGDVTPMQRNNPNVKTAQFGDVVSISRPSSSVTSPSIFEDATPEKKTSNEKSSGLSDVELLKQRKTRNIAVAILSIALAVGNYAYEWKHPVTPIQLLVNMERSSAKLSDIGKNSKPTVIDFWAPWCENCRYMAPTLFQIEESYKDKVNFVLVNGDDPGNWPLIEALGVDAIPHMALVESDGTVDTALIGAVPKEWLSRDIDVLLENSRKDTNQTPKQLPYQMLDVFANRPDARKITNLDAAVEKGKR
eukprot:CAMPEP_0197191346 /NCGR_PEP_ID=MMETSP1423-20130617/23215_1 /TAXON_ID=476441 /ORGANISM="Pseudo-nitzschia heimii, Strain UNC1101" /LENGTH=361 /DNA_ID=CAMNT_0042643953 /DNA_START=179 /DNA_END=1264 /DNA_ORIENTATION=+